MIDVLSPTPQNDLSEGSKRTRTVQFTYDSNNLNTEKHCRRQGNGRVEEAFCVLRIVEEAFCSFEQIPIAFGVRSI